VQVGAVVGLAEVVAQLHRADPPGDLGNQQRVAERLAHLLAAGGEQAVVQPVASETVPGRSGLGRLALVVGGDQVDAAAVDVERGAEVFGGHRRALQVPAGTAGPPRGGPRRLPGTGALPQGEVAGVAFGARVTVLCGAHLFEALVGQRPVLGVGGDVEVHVTGAVLGHVSVPAVDEPPHQFDHFRDVPGGARLHRGRQAAQGVVGLSESAVVAFADLPPLHAFGRGDVEN